MQCSSNLLLQPLGVAEHSNYASLSHITKAMTMVCVCSKPSHGFTFTGAFLQHGRFTKTCQVRPRLKYSSESSARSVNSNSVPYLECVEGMAVQLFEVRVVQKLDEVVLFLLVAKAR